MFMLLLCDNEFLIKKSELQAESRHGMSLARSKTRSTPPIVAFDALSSLVRLIRRRISGVSRSHVVFFLPFSILDKSRYLGSLARLE